VIITAAPAERVRELSEALRLIKAKQAKGLHTNKENDDIGLVWAVGKPTGVPLFVVISV
jgi:hypothetical protein